MYLIFLSTTFNSTGFIPVLISHFFHLLKKGVRNTYYTSTQVHLWGRDVVTVFASLHERSYM